MFRIVFLLIGYFFCLGSQAAIIAGNSNGSVTMIEIYDYQCAHCHNMFLSVQKLIEHNHDLKIRFMPVAILNQTSIYEAAAAIAATKYNGKFKEFTDLVMSQPKLSKDEVDGILKEINLTSPEFIAYMHSKEVKDQMDEGLKLLKSNQSGTPLFIIYPTNKPKESRVFSGEQNYKNLQGAIENARNF